MQLMEKVKAREAARSVVYFSLAEAFRQPSPDLPEGLAALTSAMTRLSSGGKLYAVDLEKCYHSAADQHSLKVDHTMLFIGPYSTPAPPYGSVYLEDGRRLMGGSTIDVRRHYLSRGLDLASGFMDAPDHVTVELEFMHALISMGIAAIDADDFGVLSDLLMHQRIFLEKHIGAWIPVFTDKVIQCAGSDFYRYLAMATKIFINEEMEAANDTFNISKIDPLNLTSRAASESATENQGNRQ